MGAIMRQSIWTCARNPSFAIPPLFDGRSIRNSVFTARPSSTAPKVVGCQPDKRKTYRISHYGSDCRCKDTGAKCKGQKTREDKVNADERREGNKGSCRKSQGNAARAHRKP
jgi:hypothetical protein